MKIKIILTTGKEIELTKEEFDELKNGKMLMSDKPVTLPYYPVYPGTPIPWWINPWTNPTVTYADGQTTTTTVHTDSGVQSSNTGESKG